jgi:acyl-CoA reductase-like NAD-dependent aldehyde dehydrogenase
MAERSTKKPRKTTKAARKPNPRKSPRTKAPEKLISRNPATGEVLGEVPTTPPGEVAEVVARARKVQPEWAAIPPEGRARIMREVRYRFYDLMDEIVETVAAECGKPRPEALAHDVLPPVASLLTLERIAPKALKPEKSGLLERPVLPKLLAGTVSRTEWRPFGVVGCITPWNYPITNSFLSFAAALFAGNAVVVKPTEVTPQCGELVRQLLEPLPAGVASVIQGTGEVGAALVDAPCDKISFIGSPVTGRRICEAAAKHLTPVVMELGGKDAAIVCADADADVASSGVLWGSFFNAGQTCCSIERTYVVDSVADEFTNKLLDKLQRVEQGEEIGPLMFAPQLEVVQRHVSDAIEKGATVLAGGPDEGRRNKNGSLWFAPTVVTDVNDEMQVLTEETFGPVVSIVRVRDEDEAVRRANEESVNLTASIWTRSRSRADEIGARLRAGTVSVNQHGETPGFAWSPWGGVGESGFGRLNGYLGLREFSVPVHVARSQMPMKRFWWYPYDDEMVATTREAVTAFAARTVGERIKGLRGLVSGSAKVLRNKL